MGYHDRADTQEALTVASGDLLIEFSGAPPSELQVLTVEHPEDVVVMRSKGLSAPEYTTVALISLTALRLIAPIVCAHIEAKQHVRCRFKAQELDIELQGLDQDQMLTVIETALSDLKDVSD
jgi:hypothetical protein